jgi:hypothetical protein
MKLTAQPTRKKSLVDLSVQAATSAERWPFAVQMVQYKNHAAAQTNRTLARQSALQPKFNRRSLIEL